MPETNRAVRPTPEQVSLAASADVAVTEQLNAGAVSSEIPASHPDIDPSAFTVESVIVACKGLAEIAKQNRGLAESMAGGALQNMKEEKKMRQDGMDDAAIRKQQWAAKSQRHQEKVKAAEEPEAKAVSMSPAQAEATTAPDAAIEQQLPEVAIPSPTKKRISGTEPVSASDIRERPMPLMPEQLQGDDAVRLRALADRPVEAANIASHEQFAQHIAAHEAARRAAEGLEQMAKLHTAHDLETVVYSSRDAGHELQDIEHEITLRKTSHEHAANAPGVAETAPEVIDEPTEAAPEVIDEPTEVFDYVEQFAEPYTPTLEAPPFQAIEELMYEDVLESLSVENGEGLTETLPFPAIADLANEDDGQLPEAIEPITWADALEQEPLELYANFTEALKALAASVELPIETTGQDETSESGERLDAQIELQVAAPEPLPAIAVAVSERLNELTVTEKETAAAILAEVLESVQTIEELQAEAAKPEALDAATLQLEEHVMALFERLNIEYERADVEQFMAVMLRPDFVPPQPTTAVEEAVDLERDGTHEAKKHWSQVATSLISLVEGDVNRLLGSLALFNYAA